MDELRAQHREDITDFAQRVTGADVAFHAVNYREWIGIWTGPAEVIEHDRAVLECFAP